jgi:hypothetical protein
MTAGGDDCDATPNALQHQTAGNAPTKPANPMTGYGMTSMPNNVAALPQQMDFGRRALVSARRC